MKPYNPWPLGPVPKDMQRPELDQVKEQQFNWKDPRDVVTMFEKRVADFAGVKHAVAVDSCSHAIFLCLKYRQWERNIPEDGSIPLMVPKHTYVSVPMYVLHAGFQVHFTHIVWKGSYELKPVDHSMSPFGVVDAATRWTEKMFKKDHHSTLNCISFQFKKRIPIGKGGMVLTHDSAAAEWIRSAADDGRNLKIPYDKDTFTTRGWHYYMTPEDAARGLILMDMVPKENSDYAGWEDYPNLEERFFVK